jgi:hypothetical protein
MNNEQKQEEHKERLVEDLFILCARESYEVSLSALESAHSVFLTCVYSISESDMDLEEFLEKKFSDMKEESRKLIKEFIKHGVTKETIMGRKN